MNFPMASIDREWIMNRRNIRSLQRAADAAGDDESTPRGLKRHFTDLEEILRRLDRALKRYKS